ncbi:hypothetical protein B0H10DRAFT_1938017 [Mycena sp. CBHHK59/15]|nr:hypothetical protein B0H10DRAFT_1938017 [Mycena sp. CBHHK59/15]
MAADTGARRPAHNVLQSPPSPAPSLNAFQRWTSDSPIGLELQLSQGKPKLEFMGVEGKKEGVGGIQLPNTTGSGGSNLTFKRIEEPVHFDVGLTQRSSLRPALLRWHAAGNPEVFRELDTSWHVMARKITLAGDPNDLQIACQTATFSKCGTSSNCGLKLPPSSRIGDYEEARGRCSILLQKHAENLTIANQEIPDASWLAFVAPCFLTLLSALDLHNKLVFNSRKFQAMGGVGTAAPKIVAVCSPAEQPETDYDHDGPGPLSYLPLMIGRAKIQSDWSHNAWDDSNIRNQRWFIHRITYLDPLARKVATVAGRPQRPVQCQCDTYTIAVSSYRLVELDPVLHLVVLVGYMLDLHLWL